MRKALKFKGGIILNPLSTDPASPAEGELQYFDGSTRAEGVYVFTNSEWVPVGGSVTLGPRDVELQNPRFEADTSNWTFTSNYTGYTFSRVDVNPLSGEGSGRITLVKTDIQNPTNATLETTFTLEGESQLNQTIKLNFDYLINNNLGSTLFNTAIELEIAENTSGTVIASRTLTNLDEDEINNITLQAETISPEDTYIVRFKIDGFTENSTDLDSIITIDNFLVEARPTKNLTNVDPLVDLRINLGIVNPHSPVWQPVAFNIIKEDVRGLWTYENNTFDVGGGTLRDNGYLTADRDMELFIDTRIELEGSSFSQGNGAFIAIWVNDVFTRVLDRFLVPYTSGNMFPFMTGSTTIKLKKGDTLQLRMLFSSSSGGTKQIRHQSQPEEYVWMTIKVKDL